MAEVGSPVVAAAEVSDGALPMNARKEQFSLAFVRMVVAAAGCSIKSHETDYDGVDITIVSSAEYTTHYCPSFELQVKCTTQHNLLSDDHIAWQMKADPFAKLTHPKRYLEAVLGVLLIPGDPDPWLEQDEHGMLTRSRMYWQRAADLGTIADDQGYKTVHLPRSNLFDEAGLLGILQRIGEGGER